ncbi:aspartic peptidase domain-containing protein [Flagelloscypha sp. PMI_526]|nr:aspartic peptidase domain-containing protein [Flagelloscypha sp. PMI_526]
MSFPYLALVVVASCFLLASSDPISVPVVRKDASAGLDLQSLAAGMAMKYGRSRTHKFGQRAKQSSGLMNYDEDTGYFAVINIGTPLSPDPRQFSVLVDTGSSDLWVTSQPSGCKGADNRDAYANDPVFPLYDSSKSSTYKGLVFFYALLVKNTNTTVTYGSGEVEGKVATEMISFEGFLASEQSFINVLDDDVCFRNNSGLLGLAWPSLSEIGKLGEPFWLTLSSHGVFDNKEFGFYLARGTDKEFEQLHQNAQWAGGMLTLGGVNETVYTGDIEFLNLTKLWPTAPEGFWQLNLSAISISNQSIDTTPGNQLAVIDTGTSFIGGPTVEVTTFWSFVPGSEALSYPNEGFWEYPCSTELDVGLTFAGGRQWKISDEDMVLQRFEAYYDEPAMCAGSFFDLGATAGPFTDFGNVSWIIGGTFLKNVYSVFRENPPSVGFAELNPAFVIQKVTPENATANSTQSTNTALSRDMEHSVILLLVTAFACLSILL